MSNGIISKKRKATDCTDSTEINFILREISGIRGFFISAFREIRGRFSDVCDARAILL